MAEEKTLGELLRDERERRGESLEQVHERTGIGVRVLASLEDGSGRVVEPVYLRLALTSYGEYLGLASGELLAAFDRDHRLPPASEVRPGPQAPRATAWHHDLADRLHRISPLWLGGAAALPLVALIVAIVSLRGGRGASSAPADADRPATAPPAATASGTIAAPVSPPPPRSESARPRTSPTVSDVPPAQPAAAPEAEASAPPPAGAALTAATVDGPRVAPMPPAQQAPAPPAASQELPVVRQRGDLEALAAGDAVVVEGIAVDSTWVQVQWDGRGTSEEIVPRGQRRLWAGRDSVLVRAGRAHGIRFSYQGQVLGNGRLGDPTKVLRFRADRDGVVLLGPDLEPLSRVTPAPAQTDTATTGDDVAGP